MLFKYRSFSQRFLDQIWRLTDHSEWRDQYQQWHESVSRAFHGQSTMSYTFASTNCVLTLVKSLYNHNSHIFPTISFLILYEGPLCPKELSVYPIST